MKELKAVLRLLKRENRFNLQMLIYVSEFMTTNKREREYMKRILRRYEE